MSVLCRVRALAAVALLVGALGACDSNTGGGPSVLQLRLGYLTNLTHATPLVGVEDGIYARSLGPGIALRPVTFNAGPAAIEALKGGSLDAAYVGPNSAVNAFVTTHGRAIRIIAGAASGGASLVVRKSISGAADLRGKRIADPQLGGTQDIALRTWLASQGYRTDTNGGGDVAVLPEANALTLQAFHDGQIDGAWVPEPWATRMVVEGGGQVLVDEATLWPGGRFATTLLIVRTDFLAAHADAVHRLLEGHYATNDLITQDPDAAKPAANVALRKLTGKPLDRVELATAWSHLLFLNDPLAATVLAGARRAAALGLLPSADLTSLFDLGPLNAVLTEHGRPAVAAT